ncbi:fascin-2, partial [Pteropus alecto]|uniref:fascin-2 n=1 Tax=Pteropus alecto TaxID=9402 RepID=UPI000768508D
MPTNGLHQVLKIQFGLVNDTDRYLTAESFGFKVNASAPSLKRKQLWVLEPDPGQGTAVLLRSQGHRTQTVCEAEAWTASYLDVSCGCTGHSDGVGPGGGSESSSPGLMSAVPLLPRRLRGAAPSPLSVTLPARLSRAKAHGVWVNVSANQDEELDHETFLMQIDHETKKCTFYSSTGGYWTLVTHGGIQATATQVSANTMFEMEWRGRRVALKASNGRYVCMKKNGQLAAISDFVGSPNVAPASPEAQAAARTEQAVPAGQDEEFVLKLINRPILVLRGLDGFVCHRRGSNQLDTNRSVYDVFHLSFNDGAYQ